VLLGLLTPVAKTWSAEYGLAPNNLPIQVHGGYGYTRDFDLEQLYRDNRLNSIHEGATGIQAIDLLGLRILRDDGAGLAGAGRRIAACCASADGELAVYAQTLTQAWAKIGRALDGLREPMVDIFLVSAVRTAIGSFGDALKNVAPTDFAVGT
jgi:hypothetical protein